MPEAIQSPPRIFDVFASKRPRPKKRVRASRTRRREEFPDKEVSVRSQRARWLLFSILITAVIGCTSQTAQKPVVDAAAIKASIDSVDKAFSAGMAARDTEAV